MTEPVRLFIVTDDPARACMAVLSCRLAELPSFAKIAMTPEDIRQIPDGARCIGQWFAWSDRRPDEAQMAWDWRKAVGGIEGVSEAFFQRIDEWNEKRRAAEAKILADAVAELEAGPVMSFGELVNANAAANAEATDKVAIFPRQSRWH